MLKIAVVEEETVAKEVVFDLHDILEVEYSFTYYQQITDLIKDNDKEYDLIVLNIKYNNDRVHKALEYRHPHHVYLYLCNDPYKSSESEYGQLFFLDVENIKSNLLRIKKALNARLSRHIEHLFAYDGIMMKLKYHDIYYVEKDEKNIVYYTKQGEFVQRAALSKVAEQFEQFGFIQINSGTLVNYEYIFKVDGYNLELNDKTILNISRSRKPILSKYLRAMIQKN